LHSSTKLRQLLLIASKFALESPYFERESGVYTLLRTSYKSPITFAVNNETLVYRWKNPYSPFYMPLSRFVMSYYAVPKPPVAAPCYIPAQCLVPQPPEVYYQGPPVGVAVPRPPVAYAVQKPPVSYAVQPPPVVYQYQPPPEVYQYQLPPEVYYYQPAPVRVQ
jgi:hypothetical protein